jgi:hypothetical protein
MDVLLRLSAQRALLGAIPPPLRAVSAAIDSHVIRWRAVFEREPTEDEAELLSVAATEVIADFPEGYLLEEEFVVMDPPGQIESLTFSLYKRHELV